MADTTDRSILIVEDQAIIALEEKMMLEKHGLRVSVVHSGEAAVAAAAADGIDLILMDIDLGSGMDGTTAAATILEMRTIPIVFLTSHSERDVVEKVKGITRYGYVLKNSGEFVLFESIQTAFELFDAHRALERSERRYRTMVETAPMPFQSLNADGCIVDVNRAWLRTLGYERDEVIGRWFGDLVHPDQRELFRSRFPVFKERGHIEAVDFRLRRSDGTYAETVFNGCIAYTDAGEFSHTVCVFQEVHQGARAG